MKEFLNEFMGEHRQLQGLDGEHLSSTFRRVVDVLTDASDPGILFRPKNAINAAVFDAVTVGMARWLEREPAPQGEAVADAYNQLLENEDFIRAYSRATADEG